MASCGRKTMRWMCFWLIWIQCITFSSLQNAALEKDDGKTPQTRGMRYSTATPQSHGRWAADYGTNDDDSGLFCGCDCREPCRHFKECHRNVKEQCDMPYQSCLRYTPRHVCDSYYQSCRDKVIDNCFSSTGMNGMNRRKIGQVRAVAVAVSSASGGSTAISEATASSNSNATASATASNKSEATAAANASTGGISYSQANADGNEPPENSDRTPVGSAMQYGPSTRGQCQYDDCFDDRGKHKGCSSIPMSAQIRPCDQRFCPHACINICSSL